MLFSLSVVDIYIFISSSGSPARYFSSAEGELWTHLS